MVTRKISVLKDDYLTLHFYKLWSSQDEIILDLDIASIERTASADLTAYSIMVNIYSQLKRSLDLDGKPQFSHQRWCECMNKAADKIEKSTHCDQFMRDVTSNLRHFATAEYQHEQLQKMERFLNSQRPWWKKIARSVKP